MRAGRRDLIRDLNRSLVLNLVRERGPLSRAEAARLSGLSSSTVTEIVAVLLADGYLMEEGRVAGGSAGIGRPATLLRVNPAAGFVVGLKLTADSLTATVTDLAAEVRGFVTVPHPPATSRAGIVAAFDEAVALALEAAGVDRGDVMGLGVGAPGAVADGRLGGSPIPGLAGIDLPRLLEEQFGLPAYLDNDVNTLTIAEQLYGAGAGASTFVVVTVGRGIGMGIVVNGVLHRGRRGAAGELGHVLAAPDGPRCWCGRRGCLEALAAEPALVRDVLAATGRLHPPSELAALAAREPGVAAILASAGRLVGRAVGDAATILDPERVILSGEGVRLGPAYLDAVRDGVRSHHGMADLELVVEPWGDETWARGAATLVLRELFHPAHLRGESAPSPAAPRAVRPTPTRARMGRGGPR
ncbi:MAG: ROK family transcriptional regulator [Chloroflexi bacterium]|nr:ROK family transcriptional regulator [Chloroflexota bacterium]